MNSFSFSISPCSKRRGFRFLLVASISIAKRGRGRLRTEKSEKLTVPIRIGQMISKRIGRNEIPISLHHGVSGISIPFLLKETALCWMRRILQVTKKWSLIGIGEVKRDRSRVFERTRAEYRETKKIQKKGKAKEC